jgi:hypothetical protein
MERNNKFKDFDLGELWILIYALGEIRGYNDKIGKQLLTELKNEIDKRSYGQRY